MARRTPIAAFWLALVTALVVPGAARADEIDDFEAARRAFERHEFADAARRLEEMVGGEVPALSSEVLVLEARKYLGATYLFLGRRDAAEEQFMLLLRQDPTYQLDPLAFAAAVVDAFKDVRERFQTAMAAAEEERQRRLETLRQRRLEGLLRQQARVARLEALAREETVEVRASRAIALLPFGVGQFQNGHRSAGLGFAVTQGILTLFSVSTWIWHRWLRGQAREGVPPNESGRFERQERAARVLNQLSFGTLAAVAVAGIADAQIRFVPVRTERRTRDIPDWDGDDGEDRDIDGEDRDSVGSEDRPDVDEPVAVGGRISVGVGPGAVMFQGTF